MLLWKKHESRQPKLFHPFLPAFIQAEKLLLFVTFRSQRFLGYWLPVSQNAFLHNYQPLSVVLSQGVHEQENQRQRTDVKFCCGIWSQTLSDQKPYVYLYFLFFPTLAWCNFMLNLHYNFMLTFPRLFFFCFLILLIFKCFCFFQLWIHLYPYEATFPAHLTH